MNKEKYFPLQCPKCPKRMGGLARYCNACGAKLPEPDDPDTLVERGQSNVEIAQYFEGGLCGLEHHVFLEALARSEKQNRFHCPDCGKQLI